ncbi:MAG: histidine phosphatase family protein [Candidatus Krumholzibacteriia bacterium]
MTPGLRLYFLRHGRADRDQFAGPDDGLRPLVEAGRHRTRLVADLLLRLDSGIDAVVTSPLLRARQTAEIVAGRLGLTDTLIEDARLGPGFDLPTLAAVLAGLAGDPRRILMVGHEPSLSTVIGEIAGGRVVLRKGALARVDLTVGRRLRGELVWLLQPRVLLTCQGAAEAAAHEPD